MWKKIGEISLRTGEIMEICMVKAPDESYERDIMSFLAHKKEIWLWHLNLGFRGELNELESRFYIGLLNGKLISNASTWEYGSIGIVGHLFTVNEHRGKGACTALMKAQIQDFRNREGKILIGGFKPSSFPIAKSLGFKSIINGSEVMRYDLYPYFEKEYFQSKRTLARDSMWKDWPGVSLLFSAKEGCALRSMKHKIFGPFDYEDYFLEDMREQLKRLCTSKVLVTEKGSIAGYATLTLKSRFGDNSWLLDLFVHQDRISHVGTMLKALRWPKGRVRCYIETNCHEKRRALLAQGFKDKAVLQKRVNGKPLKIIAMQLETENS
ncbi:MAG: GNAT family N-acetyltransferase [Candidatus Bathyarchaeota archaeon]|nr:GNAT family N-acetyltransferase [Candidatus Bathyarchaeota archaeon]